MNILTKEVLQAIKSGLLIPSAEVVKAMADGLLEKIEPATRRKVEEISFVYNDCSWNVFIDGIKNNFSITKVGYDFVVYYNGVHIWRYETLEEAKTYIGSNALKGE